MNSANLLTTFRAQLVADKKKTAALVGLFCVLCVVGGRAIFTAPAPEMVRASPAAPQAAPPPRITPVAETRQPVPSGSVRAAPQPPRPIASTAAAPERDPAAGWANRSRAALIDALDPVMERDLFATPRWKEYALVSDPEADAPPSAKVRDFWGSVLRAADEKRRLRRDEAAALARELAELQLQSTLTGPCPSAHISGRLVHEGDVFSGFSVVQIRDRKVVLRKSGQVHELRMQ
jgi:hypothetical protein